MKKAINIWSFDDSLGLEEKMTLAAAAGFAGIEVDLTPDGPISLDSTEDELSSVKEMAASAGIVLSGMATGLYWEHNPVSDSAATRDKASQVLERQIESAAALGIDNILVVPGAVGVDFIPSAEVVPYDVAFERAGEFLERALPQARSHGVTICVENVWNKFLLSPLEMKSFVDRFDDPMLRVYFDVGNALASGYPEQWIRILGQRIARVHLKDYRRAVGSVDGFVELLSGDVNWPEVVSALEEVGYSEWLTAEMIPPVPFYKHAPETLIYNTSRAIDSILGMRGEATDF